MADDMTPEQLAKLFHDTYERLAPSFGYQTRPDSAKPWANVPEPNKSLMIAVAAEVLAAVRAEQAESVNACADYRPDANGECLNCDEPIWAHITKPEGS